MTSIPEAVSLHGWRKSSYSENGSGGCIEVSDGFPGAVPVRDSKNPTGPALVVPAASWSAFVATVKSDELPAV